MTTRRGLTAVFLHQPLVRFPEVAVAEEPASGRKRTRMLFRRVSLRSALGSCGFQTVRRRETAYRAREDEVLLLREQQMFKT